jgi:RimJ/RimL family protein N-acetyltransferase
MFLTEIQQILPYMPNVRGVYYLPFFMQHLSELNGTEMYTKASLTRESFETHIQYQSSMGPAITAFVNNKPVAVFGCVMIWNGVGEVWSLLSEESRRYPIAMTKAGIAFIDIVEILFRLHRVQITVKTSDARAIRWAKALGFQSEGVLKQYSADKEDYNILRRT